MHDNYIRREKYHLALTFGATSAQAEYVKDLGEEKLITILKFLTY